MQSVTLIVLAVVVAVALAEGQYYVPRAYYTIDAEGHASPPVPLRRLRRSLRPYPYSHGGSNARADADASADASGWGNADAHAHAHAQAGAGGWSQPSSDGYGASNPALGQ